MPATNFGKRHLKILDHLSDDFEKYQNLLFQNMLFKSPLKFAAMFKNQHSEMHSALHIEIYNYLLHYMLKLMT